MTVMLPVTAWKQCPWICERHRCLQPAWCCGSSCLLRGFVSVRTKALVLLLSPREHTVLAPWMATQNCVEPRVKVGKAQSTRGNTKIQTTGDPHDTQHDLAVNVGQGSRDNGVLHLAVCSRTKRSREPVGTPSTTQRAPSHSQRSPLKQRWPKMTEDHLICQLCKRGERFPIFSDKLQR